MFERISNGLALAKSSWHVLMKDKQLILFPVVSGALFLLVMVSFAVPLGVLVDWAELDVQFKAGQTPWWVYAVAFAFYFCTYFVMIFCNSALVSCALMRFNGQEPTLGDGFRVAMSRLPQIFAWALVSATVGVILKAIENAHEKIGMWVSAILGAAWSVMTYFVIPVLVVEKTGPFEAVSRSIAVLKKSWGEALVGQGGLTLVLMLVSLPFFFASVLGVVFLSGNTVLGVVLLSVGVIGLLALMAVGSTLETILLAALYQYSTDDRVPEEFDRNLMTGAFASKPA